MLFLARLDNFSRDQYHFNCFTLQHSGSSRLLSLVFRSQFSPDFIKIWSFLDSSDHCLVFQVHQRGRLNRGTFGSYQEEPAFRGSWEQLQSTPMCSFPPSWATRPFCMKGWKWNLSQGSCRVWLSRLGYMDWSPKRLLCPCGLVKYTEKGRWLEGKHEEVALGPELGPMSTGGEDITSLIHLVPRSSQWWDTLSTERLQTERLQPLEKL